MLCEGEPGAARYPAAGAPVIWAETGVAMRLAATTESAATAGIKPFTYLLFSCVACVACVGTAAAGACCRDGRPRWSVSFIASATGIRTTLLLRSTQW